MARSRTTAEPFNALAVKHGAKSQAIVALSSVETNREILDAVSGSGDYLAPADGFLVERAAVQLARLRLLDQYLERLGGSPIDSRGRVRKCMPLVLALERQFAATCSALGLSPLARAQLLGDVASARRDDAVRQSQERLRLKVAADASQE